MNLRYLSLTFFLILIVSVAFANIVWLQNSNNFNVFQSEEIIKEINTAEEPETVLKTAEEPAVTLELSQDDVKGENVGIANPATIYCIELGYSHKIIETREGQVGICMFPDGSECDEWKFYSGECGAEFNYCAQNRYETITMSDGNDPFSITYSVCIRKNKIIGSVSDLMNLAEKLLPGCQTDLADSELNIAGASEKSIPKTIGKGAIK